jgi:hypothetical protein
MTSNIHHHRDKACLVSLRVTEDHEPIFAVRWDQPEDERDSGYTVVARDDVLTSTDGFTVACLHCLLESHPEAGKLMDEARQAGGRLGVAFASPRCRS